MASAETKKRISQGLRDFAEEIKTRTNPVISGVKIEHLSNANRLVRTDSVVLQTSTTTKRVDLGKILDYVVDEVGENQEVVDSRKDTSNVTHRNLKQRLDSDFNTLNAKTTTNKSLIDTNTQKVNEVSTEVQNARTSDLSGQTYNTLKERLDDEVALVDNAIMGINAMIEETYEGVDGTLHDSLKDRLDVMEDKLSQSGGDFLPLSGGTMKGNIEMDVYEIVGNSQTATKLKTDRQIKIGAGAAKSLNDEMNLTWTVPDIGINWNTLDHITNRPAIKSGVGTNSVILTNSATAGGNQAISCGAACDATGNYSFAGGYNSTSSGAYSYALCYNTEASGQGSFASGNRTKAIGEYSHAEGYYTEAQGQHSHAEGDYTVSSNRASHSQGRRTTASGMYSHAGGYGSIASGNSSFASGYYVNTQGYCQTTIGKYNVPNGTTSTALNTHNAFIIGNGTADDATSNAFRVTWGGEVYAIGTYNTGGADYAEMFEWQDGNPNEEDRRGYFVTFDRNSNMIRKANSSDTFILGAVSTNAAMLGDNYDEWEYKYVRDEWDNIIYDKVQDDDGNFHDVPRLSPTYDPNKEYIPRELRKEWSPIGLLGKVLVYSDGTCRVGQYCKPNDDGIATKSNDGHYVLEVRPNNIVKVLIK